MGLFDNAAGRLASRPAVLFAAVPADQIRDAIASYDPRTWVRRDRFEFRNGVVLHGPVEVTPETASKAGLPGGMTVAYYSGTTWQSRSERRSVDDKRQDGRRLIRGLAARLGGTIHDPSPAMDLTLQASVYSEQPLPVADVIDVLRPFAGEDLEAGPIRLEGGYALRPVRGTILFLTTYMPPWVSTVQQTPPAVGKLRRRKPCCWELYTSVPAQDAGPEDCQTVGGAALALAVRTGGVVTDVYGFAVGQPEDLMPR
jgi:hypothetical protein